MTFPDTVFVVYAHQGYDYLYTDLDGNPSDPPIYRYHIQYQGSEQAFPTLSAYLQWLLQGGSVIPLHPERAKRLRAEKEKPAKGEEG